MLQRRQFFLSYNVSFFLLVGLFPAAQTLEGRVEQTEGRAKQTFTYKVVGDCRIQADFYRLPDTVVRPAIFWIHGGALILGDRSNLNHDQMERYVRAGYVVVSIDYRLAPETKLKGIIEDVQDAYAWVRTEGPRLSSIDPNRIAVVGGSAGGYLTLMTGFCVSPRPKALVSFYGYGDIIAPWYSRPDPFYNRLPPVSKQEAYRAVGGHPISGVTGESDRGRFYLYCRQHGFWPKEVVGHDPDKEPRAFYPFCPIRNVTHDYPPTMLLHGDKDTDVPFEQSILMARELERDGVEHEFIRIPNGGHGFDGAGQGIKDPNIARTFDRVLAFLDKHLK
jgi:acetyl esterase/lipase